jgi:hypothetical protein
LTGCESSSAATLDHIGLEAQRKEEASAGRFSGVYWRREGGWGGPGEEDSADHERLEEKADAV